MEAYGLLAPLRKRMGTSEGLVSQLKADLGCPRRLARGYLYTVQYYEAQFGVDRKDLVGCVDVSTGSTPFGASLCPWRCSKARPVCNDNLHDRWATMRMAGLSGQSRRKM
jgi:hypothetical protein